MVAVEKKGPKPGTQAFLARNIGVSVTSLSAWAKLPGAPATWDPQAWKEFMAASNLGLKGNKVRGERETWLNKKLERETRLLDLKIAKEEGNYIERTAANEFMLHVATMQKTVLYQRLGRELGARGEGKSAAELNALGQAIADEICTIMVNGLEQFNANK